MSKEKTTIKDYLENSIPKELLPKVTRSFEIVGDIAITEIPQELIEYENKIGEAILKVNKSLKVVLKKDGNHGGEFRTQDMKIIAGENRKETEYKENGIRLKINPETVYFSARLSTEREELMENIPENKKVLVMFSGCGPYSFVALKKQPNLSRIDSIEINPEGHKYSLESLKLNKNLIKKSSLFKEIKSYFRENNLKFIEKFAIENLNYLKFNFYNADVRKKVEEFKLEETSFENFKSENQIFEKSPEEIIALLAKKEEKEIYLDLNSINKEPLKIFFTMFCKKFTFNCKIEENFYKFESKQEKTYLLNYLEGQNIEQISKYDEIFMPLPKDAELFLDCAFKTGTKNTIIHMYDFLHENEFPHKSENAIKKIAKKHNKEVEILQTRKVGQYAPLKYRTCCDFRIL